MLTTPNPDITDHVVHFDNLDDIIDNHWYPTSVMEMSIDQVRLILMRMTVTYEFK